MSVTITANMVEPQETVAATFGTGDAIAPIIIFAQLNEPAEMIAARLAVLGKVTLSASLAEPQETITAHLLIPIRMSASMSEPRETLQAYMKIPFLMRAVIVEPQETLRAALNFNIVMTAVLVEPREKIQAVLSILGVTAGKKVIVLNTLNNANSEYTNYNFDKIVELNGELYGIIPGDGTYILEGTDDDGTAIDTILQPGLSDYGTSQKKNVPDMFIGCELNGQMQVRGVVDEGAMLAPQFASDGTGGIKTKRVKMPLGKLSRYWGAEIRNVAGASLNIDTIERSPVIGQRRV